MSISTNQSAKIAAKYAASPEVRQLFEQLSRRADELAEMQDEFIEVIKRNRMAREGKAVKLSRSEKRTIREFERDAERANQDTEQYSSAMDDEALLTSELS